MWLTRRKFIKSLLAGLFASQVPLPKAIPEVIPTVPISPFSFKEALSGGVIRIYLGPLGDEIGSKLMCTIPLNNTPEMPNETERERERHRDILEETDEAVWRGL